MKYNINRVCIFYLILVAFLFILIFIINIQGVGGGGFNRLNLLHVMKLICQQSLKTEHVYFYFYYWNFLFIKIFSTFNLLWKSKIGKSISFLRASLYGCFQHSVKIFKVKSSFTLWWIYLRDNIFKSLKYCHFNIYTWSALAYI